MTIIELIAAFFGLLCVWLTARESIWSMPTGIINCVLFIYMFFTAKLYADMGLQIIFIGLIIYGWKTWLSGDKNNLGVIKTRDVSKVEIAYGFAFFCMGSALLGNMLNTYTDAALPYLDAPLAVASIIAQALLSRKVLQNWLIWIVVDVLSISMYYYKELYITSGLYFIFLCIAMRGYLKWQKEQNAEVKVA